MFSKTVVKQGEKIIQLEKQNTLLSTENESYKEENKVLRYELEELKLLKDKIARIVLNADKKQENYFVTFEKIKKELDVGKTY